jgi:hypothetical protein
VRRFRLVFFTFILAALIFAGCSRNIQNPEAVKQGVTDYLKERAATMGLNMDAMEATVNTVSFEKDVARASVMFSVKGTPGGGMSMDYVLDRKGDKWIVRSKQMSPSSEPAGGPASGALPPGHPPTEKK